jgi:hypothetical protein
VELMNLLLEIGFFFLYKFLSSGFLFFIFIFLFLKKVYKYR